MCILFAHRDQKMLSEKCCLSYVFFSIILYIVLEKNQPSFADQSDALVTSTHVYCYTFHRSAPDWSASFVCTLKAEEGHLSVLNILCSWHL